MKHLRSFNEDVSQDDYEDLKEFCELSFAYLLDNDKYHLNVFLRRPNEGVFIQIYTSMKDSMQWDDISNHFIPFLILLERKYNIDKPPIKVDPFCEPNQRIRIMVKGKKAMYFSVDDIIDEKFSLKGKIFEISIFVGSKK